MKIYSLGNKKPKISKKSYIFEGVTIIGDVEISENVNIWPGVVIRGDFDKIYIGKNCNIQENSILHNDYNKAIILEENITIGHGVILHGCYIEKNCIIGMGTTILDNSRIPKNCIVGANSLVTKKSKLEEGTLILGSPAKSIRKLIKEEREHIEKNYKEYLDLSKKYKKELIKEIK
ncbi:carbonic anhydrase/acetyltransferase-like protein (isoleucine patch superfamily) [Hypnocyclicus thermotrophus]|uniref:Carbonic anhydrase/acetyltransferase-like protein (Isoleucine patch superfamily) n=1 Tax=Hypnocyclicus thermotrophus TaxID=1627895 RepID=A0AA46I523_9FUSO|nr:gamma carbonic anhydrase family protein [Hypnocyclicus thermotrophus]TDT68542.1 carbonic anhydrase/acetyltransferase-like protein (isoleucine patch superfamily) [Hypnocyclicus thermotrophus]